MDSNTVLIVALFALIIVVLVLFFRQRIKGSIGRDGLKFDASNDPPPSEAGATIEDVKAGRNIKAHEEYNQGARVRRAEAKGDVTATSTRPRNDDGPKA